MLGGRGWRLIASEIVQPTNYVALARMPRVYERPRDVAGRYFLGHGSYPARIGVRTPGGVVAPTVHSHHDVFTVHEVFCREDYRAGSGLRVVVDVGSNIGISALYFLTRDPAAHCYLHEPVPANVERLRANLVGYEDRFELAEVAVADRGGRVRFGVEDTGRYGGIEARTGRSIEVECRPIADVLADVLEREDAVDVLKLDTEGAELPTVRAIPVEQLRRIRAIYLECDRPERVHPELFDAHFANQTLRLVNRAR